MCQRNHCLSPKWHRSRIVCVPPYVPHVSRAALANDGARVVGSASRCGRRRRACHADVLRHLLQLDISEVRLLLVLFSISVSSPHHTRFKASIMAKFLFTVVCLSLAVQVCKQITGRYIKFIFRRGEVKSKEAKAKVTAGTSKQSVSFEA